MARPDWVARSYSQGEGGFAVCLAKADTIGLPVVDVSRDRGNEFDRSVPAPKANRTGKTQSLTNTHGVERQRCGNLA